MAPEDRDQANAALLLNDKINERITEVVYGMFHGNNTVAINPQTQLPYPVSADQVVVAMMEHPHVKTKIYQLAAETARMLIIQAFNEYNARHQPPAFVYQTNTAPQVWGYVYNADSLPKHPFF